ncbi:hypothetical protein ALC57_06131, partial [Trachymyrmex cornetzi]
RQRGKGPPANRRLARDRHEIGRVIDGNRECAISTGCSILLPERKARGRDNDSGNATIRPTIKSPAALCLEARYTKAQSEVAPFPVLNHYVAVLRVQHPPYGRLLYM